MADDYGFEGYIPPFEESDTDISIVCPNLGELLQEVQNNGNNITWRTVYDVIGDFGKFSDSFGKMSERKQSKVIEQMSKEYAKGWVS